MKFPKPNKTIWLRENLIIWLVVEETWPPTDHPVEALEQPTIVEGLCLFLSVQCTQPAKNHNRILDQDSWCTRSKFDFLQFCGKSKCESGEITPHIAASTPRHTSSGTTSASSGISETLSTVVRLTAKLTLAYLNLVCLALF